MPRLTATALLLLLPLGGVADAAVEHPLFIANDGQTLLDASGDPTYFNGATPWHILTRLTEEETIDYLDVRQSQGFNAMLFSLLVSDGYSIPTTENAYGEPPFLQPGDFSKPNEAYFQHVDWVLGQMAQRGMTAFLVPVYLGFECGAEGWCPEVREAGSAVMRDFGRYVGSRYQDQPNLVYVHGGDVDASNYSLLDETNAFVEGLTEADSVHLNTAHCSRYNSGSDCYDLPWLQLETTYSDCSQTPLDLREDYLTVESRPIVYIEGSYEFESTYTPVCLRSQAYWSALGGSMSHFYGSGRIWDFPENWREGLDTEGTQSMQVFGELLRARGGGALDPDYEHQMLVAGYGDVYGSDYAAAARRSDGNTALVYVPSARTLTVDLTSLAGTEIEAWWIDPTTGQATTAGIHPSEGTAQFDPPSSGDWVLVLDNVAADLNDVWTTPTASAPTATRLEVTSAVPNPFNPSTRIFFTAAPSTDLRVEVFDARGRVAATLYAGEATGEEQSVTWHADGSASGTYFVKASSGAATSTLKIALLK